MKVFDLDVYIPGKTHVGELIKVDVVFRNGQKVTLTEELKKFKIKTGIFSIEITGRFNYFKFNRFGVDMIRFYMQEITEEVLEDAQRRIKDSCSGDGAKIR